jgi:hypothetical protein
MILLWANILTHLAILKPDTNRIAKKHKERRINFASWDQVVENVAPSKKCVLFKVASYKRVGVVSLYCTLTYEFIM